MKLLPLLLLPLSLACLTEKADGKLVTETRKAGAFDAIEVSGAMTVEVEVGGDPSVVVETEADFQRAVVTEIVGSTLVIRPEGDRMRSSPELKVRVTTPKLTRFESSGATTAKISGIEAERFTLETSGASNVELDGEVEKLDVEASGASKIMAEELVAKRVSLEASGASKFWVHASESLIAEMSGAGTVTYSGDPKEVKTDLSGAASLRKK